LSDRVRHSNVEIPLINVDLEQLQEDVKRLERDVKRFEEQTEANFDILNQKLDLIIGLHSAGGSRQNQPTASDNFSPSPISSQISFDKMEMKLVIHDKNPASDVEFGETRKKMVCYL
jgi:hypothetical protein